MRRTIILVITVVMILAMATVSIAATPATSAKNNVSVIVYTADGDQLCAYSGNIVFDKPGDYSRFTANGRHFAYQGQYIIEASDY